MDTIEKEIIRNLHTMEKEDKNKVLLFVRGLKEPLTNNTPYSSLKKFQSTINKSDLDIIEKSIQNDCERIDSNEW
jgi:hypothetical protein